MTDAPDTAGPTGAARRRFPAWLESAARTTAYWARELIYPTPIKEPPELEFMSTRGIVGRGRLIILVFVLGFFGPLHRNLKP